MRLLVALLVLVVAVTGVVLVAVNASGGDDDGCEVVTAQGVRQIDCRDVVDLVTGN